MLAAQLLRSPVGLLVKRCAQPRSSQLSGDDAHLQILVELRCLVHASFFDPLKPNMADECQKTTAQQLSGKWQAEQQQASTQGRRMVDIVF